MQLLEAFNPLDHNPEQGEGQLPVGKHPVIITGGEIKATKNNDGGFVSLALLIIDGPLKGATGPYRLNLYNASETSVRIAKSQLSALCYVTQRFQLGQNGTDLSPLFNVPFIVEVAPQADERYTEIKKVFDINGNAPKAQGGGNTQPQAPAQQTGGFVQNNAPVNGSGGFGGGGGGGFTQPAQQEPQPQTAWGGAANNQQPAAGAKPAWAK